MFDVCVIGAGSGGLTTAAFCASLGAKVVLIERDKMGGDCLNTGCVPSKSLIHASKMKMSFKEAMAHVQQAIKTIAPNDSVERFESLGVTVIKGEAKFLNPQEIIVNGAIIKAKKYVIATGSRAAIPPIKGLKDVDFLTNETIFELDTLPQKLAIIGAGAIGAELAQCFNRLGSEVTLITNETLLARDDDDAVAILRETFKDEGIVLHELVKITEVTATEIHCEGGLSIPFTHLLVVAGRTPNLENLSLENASIAFTKKGITVDKSLKTSQRHIYAIGDVAGGAQFTHAAGFHGSLVSQNILFKKPINPENTPIGYAIYTTPEIAHIGVLAKDAENLTVLEAHFTDNDRAITDMKTKGFVKLMVTNKGVLKGATIIGENAGELIAFYALALTKNLTVGDISATVIPYPTLAEAGKRAAGSFYKAKASSPFVRTIVKLLLKL